jgi:hypothetical protein
MTAILMIETFEFFGNLPSLPVADWTMPQIIFLG